MNTFNYVWSLFPKPFIIIFCLLLLCPSAPLAGENNVLHIANVYTESTSFNPGKDEHLVLHFSVSLPCKVTVNIYDSLNRKVATLLDSSFLQPGNHQVVWSGRDAEGKTFPQNYYLYTVKAQNTDGQLVHYDPSDITGGKQIGIQNISYDKVKDIVSFTIQQAAIINLRVGLVDGGPMMTTLVDWIPLTKGSHVTNWNGLNNTGNVDLKNVRKLDINGPAYTLPMNSIILTGDRQLKRPGFLADGQTEGELRPSSGNATKQIMYNHWHHQRNVCYDPEVTIKLPEDQQYNDDGLPLVSDVLKIALNASQSDRHFLINQRFEVVLYVDFLFSHEEEAGYFPYFWTWDPKGVEGIHYITAMLRGYEGHFATTTIKVSVVKNPNNEQTEE